VLKRLSVFARRARGAAVPRHDDLQVTHVGVVRRAENAAVGRQAGKDEGRRAEFPQQEVERRLVEARMHRLEDEIIVVVGLELFDEVKAGRLGPQAVLQQLFGIRPPLAEIIVDIDRGNACRAGPLLQASQRRRNRTLYIFDEPTTGLHFDDVSKLLSAFRRLIDAGGSILVIEHNLEVIKTADWVIDLGPEGGERGGYVIGSGTPEAIAKLPNSYTGKFLARVLNGNGARGNGRK